MKKNSKRLDELSMRVDAYRCYQNNCSYTDGVKVVLRSILHVLEDQADWEIKDLLKKLGMPVCEAERVKEEIEE